MAKTPMVPRLKIATASRSIEGHHIAFAMERRPRASWSALAHMLGVNAQDLQRACEKASPGRAGGA